MDRIVLAYAGGFDAAAAIAALARRPAQIVVVIMDLGQGHVLEELRDRALAAGAVRAHVLDLRETFAAGYVLPSLKADATGADGVPMPSELARALVADRLVEIAGIEQASAVAHGAANEHAAMLDAALHAIDPALTIAAVPPSAGLHAESGHRVSVNLWGRTTARAAADGRPGELPERAYTLTRAPGAAPLEPASVEVRFERGAPLSINGVLMPFVEMIATLSHLAGTHGVGRFQTPHDVVEAPAAVVLHTAHKALQKRTGGSGATDRVSRQYAGLVAAGQWSTAARVALDKIVEQSQERVNGTIRLKLFKAECQLVE